MFLSGEYQNTVVANHVDYVKLSGARSALRAFAASMSPAFMPLPQLAAIGAATRGSGRRAVHGARGPAARKVRAAIPAKPTRATPAAAKPTAPLPPSSTPTGASVPPSPSASPTPKPRPRPRPRRTPPTPSGARPVRRAAKVIRIKRVAKPTPKAPSDVLLNRYYDSLDHLHTTRTQLDKTLSQLADASKKLDELEKAKSVAPSFFDSMLPVAAGGILAAVGSKALAPARSTSSGALPLLLAGGAGAGGTMLMAKNKSRESRGDSYSDFSGRGYGMPKLSSVRDIMTGQRPGSEITALRAKQQAPVSSVADAGIARARVAKRVIPKTDVPTHGLSPDQKAAAKAYLHSSAKTQSKVAFVLPVAGAIAGGIMRRKGLAAAAKAAGDAATKPGMFSGWDGAAVGAAAGGAAKLGLNAIGRHMRNKRMHNQVLRYLPVAGAAGAGYALTR